MKSPMLSISFTILIYRLCSASDANLFNDNGIRGRQGRNSGAGSNRNKQLAEKGLKKKQGRGQVQQVRNSPTTTTTKKGAKESAETSPQLRRKPTKKNGKKKNDKPNRKPQTKPKDKDKTPAKNKPARKPAKNKPDKVKPAKKDKPNKNKPAKNTKPNSSNKPNRFFDPRIVGGSAASSNEYKFAVSLSERGSHFCGGSLIARNVVLSAAHCNGGSYDATVGINKLNQGGGQTSGMRKEIIHPDYNKAADTDADYMIVILDNPLNLDSKVGLIKPSKSAPGVGSRVTAMGWGETNPQRGLSSVLMEVNVDVISNSECDRSSDGQIDYKNQITQNMLCAKANNKDSCQGDSGGPLIAGNGDLVGIVSWGIGCADRNFPGVYAKVSAGYGWIEKTVCKESPQYGAEAGFNCGQNPSPTPPASSFNQPSPKPPKPQKPQKPPRPQKPPKPPQQKPPRPQKPPKPPQQKPPRPQKPQKPPKPAPSYFYYDDYDYDYTSYFLISSGNGGGNNDYWDDDYDYNYSSNSFSGSSGGNDWFDIYDYFHY